MVGVNAVNKVALIVLRGVVSAFGSKQRRLRNVPVASSTVFQTLYVESVCNLHFEHFDARLLDG